MTIPVVQLRLYAELADWWPLFTTPEDYTYETAFHTKVIKEELGDKAKTVLELGSGGGNSAFHLKKHFQMTLVDLSENMINVSKRINPECEHFIGNMIDFRMDRVFDVVYVQDAIAYMNTEEDLRKTIETAFVHCRPGGIALLIPDFTRENFKGTIVTGGHDRDKRGLRYMEWIWDPEPSDTSYLSDMVYMVKDDSGQMSCVYDRHILGLFGQSKWLELIKEVGFEPKLVPFDSKQDSSGATYIFACRKPN
ncbi:MAG: class I SAM-dependent DNA methyltransferase [Candidatus Zixiibacteriota bacterium]